MDAQSITFTLSAVISLIFGILGALGAWFKLKGNLDIMKVELENFQFNASTEISNLKTESAILKDELKEKDRIVHERIGSLKDVVEDNRKNSDKNHADIKTEMGAMELRIITAIHDIK